MEYLAIVLFCVCLINFVYQRILLPTYRQHARDDLFVLRDELRNELIRVQDTADKKTLKAFQEVDNGINHALNRLHLLTFSNIVKLQMSLKDAEQEYKAEFDRFHNLLDASSSDVPKQIYAETSKILNKVVSKNSFLIVLYLSPVILALSIIKFSFNRLKTATNVLLDICVVPKNIQSRNAALFEI